MSTNGLSPLTPDATLAQNDPGDETARRYRFQYAWAAIICCMLLDDTQDVNEVFCEHHEDLLIKHRNGKFTGQQVKTRELDQPVWKTNDPQIRSAFARFAQLDFEFPGYFQAFQLLTNHPLHVANNAQSVGYVLNEIAETNNISSLPSNIKKWVSAITSEANVTEAIAFSALKRASASATLPKLDDVTMRLVQTLTSCWAEAEDCSHASVVRVAQSLIDECSRASALDHRQLLPAYIAAISQPEVEVLARINGKRMNAERVQTILDKGMNATALLSGEPVGRVQPGQGSGELLLKKLDAGGFSAVSRNSAEDLRDKADYLGLVWTKKFGRDKGLDRYEHVRSLALNDAGRSFDAVKSEDHKFGPAMREDLRLRFQARRANGDNLFDCSVEHLEGFAYSLTAQCKVQWSIERPWEDD